MNELIARPSTLWQVPPCLGVHAAVFGNPAGLVMVRKILRKRGRSCRFSTYDGYPQRVVRTHWRRQVRPRTKWIATDLPPRTRHRFPRLIYQHVSAAQVVRIRCAVVLAGEDDVRAKAQHLFGVLRPTFGVVIVT